MSCQSDYQDENWKNELNRVTQMLCYLCGNLIGNHVFHKYTNQSIQDWWSKHLESDTEKVIKSIQGFYKDYPETIGNPKIVADHLIKGAKKRHLVSDWHCIWLLRKAIDVSESIKRDKKKAVLNCALRKLTEEELDAIRKELRNE